MDETFLQKRLAVLRNFKKIEKKKRERLQLQSQKWKCGPYYQFYRSNRDYKNTVDNSASTWDKPDEMDKFLETQSIEMESWINRKYISIISEEIESVKPFDKIQHSLMI